MSDQNEAKRKLQRTPLYDLHTSLGARFVQFAGCEMPVQYERGVLKEHLHTRAAAGLFDVSHMGQIVVRAKSATSRMRHRRSRGSSRLILPD